MTEDEALAAIMAAIKADLPEAETRMEIEKILSRLGHSRWSLGYDEGHEEGTEAYWAAGSS